MRHNCARLRYILRWSRYVMGFEYPIKPERLGRSLAAGAGKWSTAMLVADSRATPPIPAATHSSRELNRWITPFRIKSMMRPSVMTLPDANVKSAADSRLIRESSIEEITLRVTKTHKNNVT